MAKANVSSRLKQHEGSIQLLIVPLILFLILSIVTFSARLIEKKTAEEDIQEYTTLLPVHPYPMLKNFYEPLISAESAIIMENDSKGILYEKNPTFRFSMASTTKVMTALAALEHFHSDDVLTVKRSGVEGTGMGLYPGQKFTFESLLYAMLLPSANDAAFAIADNYPGGEKAFVARMNEKVKEFSLKNTHYGDPAGLNDDEDYTTVFDLALIASQAQKEPTLVKVASTKEKVIHDLSGREYYLENLNELLGVDGVIGLKTGQTEGAGGVLVTTAIQGDHTYIFVVMKSQNRFLDTQGLLQLLNKNVSYFQPVQF